MRIGICGAYTDLALAGEMGYDYFETSASALAAMSDEDFEAFARENDRVRNASFEGCRACNGLFPGTLPLVGPKADLEKVRAYLENLVPRLQRLGVEVVVFGSGAARRCPEGFPAETARRQLGEAALLAARMAGEAGILVGMEHLNSGETNLLTTLRETWEFVYDLENDVKNISVLPGITMDVFHLQKEGEKLKDALQLTDLVVHTHAAHLEGRSAVTPEDLAYLSAVAGGLAAQHYHGRLSLEAVLQDFEADGRAALPVLRAAAAAVEQ